MPVWLPNGDLLAGTWEGQVLRLDGATLQERWHTLLRPAGMDTAPPAAEHDAPITRITSYSNALPQPLPLGENLLAQINPSPFIHFYAQQSGNPTNLELQNDYRLLFDGKADAPKNPWLDWGTVAWFAEQYPCNYIEINTFVTQLHVTAITLVEDPAHPESWLRDIYLEYWDAEKEQWVYAQHLLSDAAVHSHQLAVPIDAARFRIVLPWGCCGNVRLAEIVFHGTVLGHANPDVRAGRPRCTLFDGQRSITEAIYGNYKLTFDDAFTGKACLTVGDEKSDGYFNMAIMHPTAGYIYPDWYVPIAENPRARRVSLPAIRLESDVADHHRHDAGIQLQHLHRLHRQRRRLSGHTLHQGGRRRAGAVDDGDHRSLGSLRPPPLPPGLHGLHQHRRQSRPGPGGAGAHESGFAGRGE